MSASTILGLDPIISINPGDVFLVENVNETLSNSITYANLVSFMATSLSAQGGIPSETIWQSDGNLVVAGGFANFVGTGVSVADVAGVATITVNAYDNFSSDLSSSNTAGLPEGSNLYYTVARANTAIDARIDTAFVSNLSIDANTLNGVNSSAFATAAAGILADSALQSSDIGVSVQGYTTVLAGTTASYTVAEESKLLGIEALATADQTAGEIEAIVNHDNLLGFVANEHIDWSTDQGATNIDAGNYTDTTYVSSDFNHDALTGFVANEHIDWSTDQGATNIDAGNYINTVYTHPSDGVDLGIALTGATIISDVAVNSAGHVTGFATRELTPANINAATTAQGSLADSALQSADIGVSVQGYTTVLAATTASYTVAEESKLLGIEALATADQTAAEIKTAYEGEASAFTDAQFTKLAGIETAADVTDIANVTAAGALMDTELASIADVKALDQSVVSGSNPTFGIANITLDDTNLTVSDTTNLQTFADGVDAALLKARGTGVTSSYVSTATIGGTTFAQPAVLGEINSDQGYFSVSYAGATGITVSNLAANSTYVYLDNTGTLQQQTSIPTRQDWSRNIYTMRIAVDTSAGTILGFEYLNNPIGHYANSIRDLYKALLAQGIPFKEGQTITGRATDLGFDVSAGSIMEFGGTGDINNANILNLSAVTHVTYSLLSRTAVIGDQTDLVKFWDNAGVITAIGSTTLVGHRLYRFSNGAFAMQYGQGNYANINLAKTGVLLEDYELNPRLLNATFFGWWFIESTATNTGGTILTDFTEYTIGVQGGSSSGLAGCLLQGNNLSDLLDVGVAQVNLNLEPGVDVQAFSTVLNNTTASYTTTEESKLAGIEALADVTDALNVDAAGAVMESDATTAAMSFVIDEDTFVTNSATRIPTQQSVKAYVDAAVASSVTYRGGYNASTNTPDLDTTPTGILVGDMYTVTAIGTFFTTALEVGDVLIAEQDDPTLETHWTVVNKDLDSASIKVSYENNADTNAFTDSQVTNLGNQSGTNTGDNATNTQYSGLATNVNTDLSTTAAPTTITINSSDGTNAVIEAADITNAGVMTTAMYDEHVLNNAKITNVTTDLAYTTAASSGTITSSDGTDATLPAATTTLAGLQTGTDKTKLDGIATGAQVNVDTNLGNTSDATSLTVTSSTGTNTSLPAATTNSWGVMTDEMFDAIALNTAKISDDPLSRYNGAVTTAASNNIGTVLPSNAYITRVIINISSVYDNASTMSVTAATGVTSLTLADDSDLLTTGTYIIDLGLSGVSGGQISATITGTPTVGASAVTVEYKIIA